MQADTLRWDKKSGWLPQGQSITDKQRARLVIFFASPAFYKQKGGMDFLRKEYPKAEIVGCSTSGEIFGADVLDDAAVASAIAFDKTRVGVVHTRLLEAESSQDAGARLAGSLQQDGLKHVYVLSDGIKVNGSALVEGLRKNLPEKTTITGGLAGDGANFGQTLVTAKNATDTCVIAAIGFYGDALKVGYGSIGGWDPFGPERLITRSQGNVLYELQRALRTR